MLFYPILSSGFLQVNEPRPGASDQVANNGLPVQFVLSRHLGSSSQYNFWLLSEDKILAHWVLANELAEWAAPSRPLLLFQAEPRAVPAAQHDHGYCSLIAGAHTTSGSGEYSFAQALADGFVSLQIYGRHLGGVYTLRRLGREDEPVWLLSAEHQPSGTSYSEAVLS